MAESTNLIAEIVSKGEKKKGDNVALVVTLKEANGRPFEWTSWHMTALNDYSVGDVIEIVPDLKDNPNGKFPYRNIKEVLGKREISEINTLDVLSGQAIAKADTPAQAGKSVNGMSDYAKAIERRSIERQTSVKLMAEIYKAGCGIDDLQMIAEAIVKSAETIETWLARQGSLATVKIPDPESYGKFIDAPVNGASTTSKATSTDSPDSYKMETVGDLFTAVKDRYKGQKTIPDIFDALHVKTKEELLVNTTIETAWLTLQSIWEGPTVQEPQPN